jgi:hypothetical protein
MARGLRLNRLSGVVDTLAGRAAAVLASLGTMVRFFATGLDCFIVFFFVVPVVEFLFVVVGFNIMSGEPIFFTGIWFSMNELHLPLFLYIESIAATHFRCIPSAAAEKRGFSHQYLALLARPL